MHNQTRQNATNTAREGRSAGMRLALNSSLFVAMALMSSVVVAFAQEAPKRADSTSLAQRTNFFSLICAQRDVQLVTLLEERGDAQEVRGISRHDARAHSLHRRTRERGAVDLRHRYARPHTRTRRAVRGRRCHGCSH
jgi:hypothetical protein